jgi:hypothetical protein
MGGNMLHIMRADGQRSIVRGDLPMTRYRCIVFQSTGNFVPYAGIDFMAASDAMRSYEPEHSVHVQHLTEEGWRTIMGVDR